MTKLTICATLSFLFSAALGKIIIKFLYRLKVGQPILSYVKEHKEKNGTATMGGVIFVLSSLAAYFIVYGFDGKYSLFGAALFFSFALIGFADDFIKIKFNKNEGLKPWQKNRVFNCGFDRRFDLYFQTISNRRVYSFHRY